MMQILLNNAEVTAAITAYVAAMVSVDLTRIRIDVDISSTRNPTGYNATVNLTPIGEAVATTSSVAVDATNWTKQAVVDEPKKEVVNEEVKAETVAQPEPEKEAVAEVKEAPVAETEVTTKPSIFGGLKKPVNE